MFKHLLAPLDGSPLAECVLPHAVALVKAFGARLTLLRVLEGCDATEGPSIDPLDWQMWKAEGAAYLGELAERLQEAGVTAEQVIQEGQSAERIIEYAHGNQVDLLILSSHGWSGLSAWNVGSTVQKIIARAQTSVMIIRAYQLPNEELSSLEYHRIMAPLDGSPRAEIVLPSVEALAKAESSQVLLTHVLRRPEMPSREPLSPEDAELSNRFLERNRDEVSRYFEQVSSRLSAPSETHLLVSDSPVVTLHEFAEQQQVDLVILAAHGYSGQSRLPYGSVPLSFITNGTTPLLVVQDVAAQARGQTLAELAVKEQKGH